MLFFVHAKVKTVRDEIEAEKKKQFEEATAKVSKEKGPKGGKSWSDIELQTLIKGVNVFPAGTKDR